MTIVYSGTLPEGSTIQVLPQDNSDGQTVTLSKPSVVVVKTPQ